MEENLKMDSYQYYADEDYLKHLELLGNQYLQSSDVIKVKFAEHHHRYLRSIIEKIMVNNELLFNNKIDPHFYFIKSDIPFYFSLPYGKFFLSTGLIKRYIKHEGDLIAILAYELIKNHKNLYRRNIIIPLGFISTERLISLLRISLQDKSQINQWVFYVLKRSNYDPYYILSWIQQQNRNSLDFSLQLGDANIIAREEYLMKNFLVDKRYNIKVSKIKKNSSNEFYRFILDGRNK